MKSAYYDPNPVVILEHKGLYWSKIKGTSDAKTIEPSEDYVIPFGKGRIVLESSNQTLSPSVPKDGTKSSTVALFRGPFYKPKGL